MKITEEKIKEIQWLFMNTDMTVRGISKKTNCSYSCVRKYIIEIDEPTTRPKPVDMAQDGKNEWLRQNWNWVIPGKSRYKKVYKGQKGSLRTPMRPDGIFR